MSLCSAGILLYRFVGGRLEVMLVHPGGPYWPLRSARGNANGVPAAQTVGRQRVPRPVGLAPHGVGGAASTIIGGRQPVGGVGPMASFSTGGSYRSANVA